MAGDLTPDWILKSVLNVQDKAHNDWLKNSHPELRPKDEGLTLTVLGCGTMGTAILSGILHSLQQDNSGAKSEQAPSVPVPDRLPSRFNVCVRTPESAQKVKNNLDRYDAHLTVYENDSVTAVKDSDVVLLSCDPQAAYEILRELGMKQALAGKLLISICGGITESSIYKMVYGNNQDDKDKCTVVRVMPNAAAEVRESMTIIAKSNPPLPENTRILVSWIFTRIGPIVELPPSMLDASSALCASGPAFVSLMVESLAAGAIASGLPRVESYKMATQMMRGTTEMLLQGQHPATFRDKVTTPGGGTVKGLAVLEENAFRGTVSKAVRETAGAISELEARHGYEASSRMRKP